jgi:hypothetical protein
MVITENNVVVVDDDDNRRHIGKGAVRESLYMSFPSFSLAASLSLSLARSKANRELKYSRALLQMSE